MRQTTEGLTIVELMVALSILAVVTATAMTAYLSTLQGNQAAGLRTRSSQVLSAVSARVTQHAISLDDGASEIFIYDANNTSTPLNLSSPPTSCSGYLSDNSTHYCVTVRNGASFNPIVGSNALLSTPADLYTIRACWQEKGSVNCAEAKTIY